MTETIDGHGCCWIPAQWKSRGLSHHHPYWLATRSGCQVFLINHINLTRTIFPVPLFLDCLARKMNGLWAFLNNWNHPSDDTTAHPRRHEFSTAVFIKNNFFFSIVKNSVRHHCDTINPQGIEWNWYLELQNLNANCTSLHPLCAVWFITINNGKKENGNEIEVPVSI
jgi:hypothetical protein